MFFVILIFITFIAIVILELIFGWNNKINVLHDLQPVIFRKEKCFNQSAGELMQIAEAAIIQYNAKAGKSCLDLSGNHAMVFRTDKDKSAIYFRISQREFGIYSMPDIHFSGRFFFHDKENETIMRIIITYCFSDILFSIFPVLFGYLTGGLNVVLAILLFFYPLVFLIVAISYPQSRKRFYSYIESICSIIDESISNTSGIQIKQAGREKPDYE